MKQLLCAVAAIALMTPSVASAQRHDNQRNQTQQDQRQKRSDRQQQRQQRQETRQAKQPSQTRTTRTVERTQVRQGQPNRVTRVTHVTRPSGIERTRRVTHVTTPSGIERTRGVTTRQVTRSLPTYRIGHRPATFRRIRAQAFRYPRGYHYRRWHRDSILPRLFLSSLYFWTDWAALGVGPPPPGYVWVRYGPDLLLVNRYNGRIADVIYGAFY